MSRFITFTWIALLLTLAIATSANASGTVTTRKVPANKRAGTLGYTVKLDSRWVDQGGYRPVRVEITPHSTSRARRVFSIQVRAESWRYRNGRETMVVDAELVIPANQQAPFTATIAVPQFVVWENLRADLWEDGEHRPDLTVRDRTLGGGWGGFENDSVMLVVSSKRSMPKNLPTPEGGPPNPNSFTGNGASLDIAPHELPTRWIDFTCVDVVLISLGDLEDLVKSHAKRWEALRAWTAVGGNLLVADVGKGTITKTGLRGMDWRNLQRLDLVLKSPGGSGKSPWRSSSGGKRCDFGLGQITATDDIADGRFAAAMVDSRNIDPDRIRWFRRTGISLDMPNSDFWKFIIPGVGRVPVTMFQVLITLFVVVIGPLNYIFLRRRGKLHLLMVTVPVCALLVATGLLGYGIIADGLGVRVRARSFTEIDQRRGEAVCWSRLCYYAGLAPSQGLKFSGDVAVLPIRGGADGSRGLEREVAWTEDGSQHLRSGWLRSRRLTQYLTMRSRRTQARLNITASAAGELTVENKLGTVIHHLIVCDADDKLYASGDGGRLADGATRTLKEGTIEVVDRMQRAYDKNRPELPQGVNEYDLRDSGYYYYYYREENSDFATGRLEAGLAAARNQLDSLKLDPRTYLAIVERSPEVEFGTPSANQEASFHVILGRW